MYSHLQPTLTFCHYLFWTEHPTPNLPHTDGPIETLPYHQPYNNHNHHNNNNNLNTFTKTHTQRSLNVVLSDLRRAKPTFPENPMVSIFSTQTLVCKSFVMKSLQLGVDVVGVEHSSPWSWWRGIFNTFNIHTKMEGLTHKGYAYQGLGWKHGNHGIFWECRFGPSQIRQPLESCCGGLPKPPSKKGAISLRKTLGQTLEAMPTMSLEESRRWNSKLKTQLQRDAAASAAWQQLCQLPPRSGKNVKKRLFLFSWKDSIPLDGGRNFGPSFWRECKSLISEDMGPNLELATHVGPRGGGYRASYPVGWRQAAWGKRAWGRD